MESRRSFIKSVSAGTLGASIASAGLSTSLFAQEQAGDKKIRVGIIGAENSHTAGLGKLFNIDKKFPGVEVLYVWGETDEFAKIAAEKGAIPNIVQDPLEMMGKIDALVVDHRHAKYHLQAALPFVKEGIPTFVDKPFCYRVEEGIEFLKTARDLGTPVTSFSSTAQSDGILDMKAQIPRMGDIEHILWYGPTDVDSKYGGVFFYSVHIVQPLMNIFGEDIVKVKVSRHGKKATASIVFKSGYFATLLFSKRWEWGVTLLTENGEKKLKSRIEESDPPRHYKDMVEMFRTGKEPRSHQSILACVAVLEALEKSVVSQEWEFVKMPGKEVGVNDNRSSVPTGYELAQNYPNPFNPQTTVRYDLPVSADVRLVIYDMQGRLVRTLVNGRTPAGSHSVIWDGRDEKNHGVSSGPYVYRIDAGEFNKVRKMTFLK